MLLISVKWFFLHKVIYPQDKKRYLEIIDASEELPANINDVMRFFSQGECFFKRPVLPGMRSTIIAQVRNRYSDHPSDLSEAPLWR